MLKILYCIRHMISEALVTIPYQKFVFCNRSFFPRCSFYFITAYYLHSCYTRWSKHTNFNNFQFSLNTYRSLHTITQCLLLSRTCDVSFSTSLFTPDWLQTTCHSFYSTVIGFLASKMTRLLHNHTNICINFNSFYFIV